MLYHKGVLAFITPFVEAKNRELSNKDSEINKLLRIIETSKDRTKVLVFTEDEGDALNRIKSILEIHKFHKNEIEIHSYFGKQNFNNALYAGDKLSKRLPNIEALIFHRDRDVDGEEFEINIRPKFEVKGREKFLLYMPNGYDIESEFIITEHIHHLYKELTIAEIDRFILEATEEAQDKSIEKICSFLYSKAVVTTMEAGKNVRNIDYNKPRKEAEKLYNRDIVRYRYGKLVMGKLMSKLQKRLKKNVNLIQYSPIIQNNELAELKRRIWG